MESDAGQLGAALELLVADAGNAFGDGDAGQARAARERSPSDAGDAVGDRDAGQSRAARERLVSDAGDAVADRHAGQSRAARERRPSDDRDRLPIDLCRDLDLTHRALGIIRDFDRGTDNPVGKQPKLLCSHWQHRKKDGNGSPTNGP